jgi:glyoxylase-like metal-dependent hydrolase (beta-lactamase superfamily II)
MEARIEGVSGTANTWIVGDDEEVIVIDPGSDPEPVLAAVGEREILAVICTHGHGAHVSAAPQVAERDEAPVALHSDDLVSWRMVHSGDPDIPMEAGGTFEVAGVKLEVLHAPGHSPGSVCLYSEELSAVFCGDALGKTGPVRHEDDFPDFPRQLSSIGGELLTLPGATRVLPGHGDELTVSYTEQHFNAWAAAGPEGASSFGAVAGLGGSDDDED